LVTVAAFLPVRREDPYMWFAWNPKFGGKDREPIGHPIEDYASRDSSSPVTIGTPKPSMTNPSTCLRGQAKQIQSASPQR